MSGPRRLGMLEDRRPALETCAYCPKLSRSACPVSEIEASETVTPWGKVTGTFDVARGATPATREHAALAWACTGCFHCKELCELKNPVAETLIAARSEYRALGLAPEASERVVEAMPARLRRIGAEVDALRALAGHRADAPTAVLLGCDYARKLGEEAKDAVRSLHALYGPLRLLSGCCGLPLELAGDPEGGERLKRALLVEARGKKRLIAVDSGCAYRLREAGALPFAEAAWDKVQHLRSLPAPPKAKSLRYHDPCLLGRGLGCYDAPRKLLARANPGENLEFTHQKALARCSGGGALLPLTRPETARKIAERRVREHDALGGGTIVTACGGSLRSFRAAGAHAVDLATVVRWLVLGQ